jgi:hypothetical protein
MLERWIGAPGTPDVAAVHCLQMRGAIAANTLDGKLALQSTQAALQRLRAAGLGGGELEADLLGDIGFALHVGGRSGEAEAYFEDALQRYRTLNRLDGLHARVMQSNWGVMELATGDVRRGLQRYEELLSGHRRLMASATTRWRWSVSAGSTRHCPPTPRRCASATNPGMHRAAATAWSACPACC